MSVLPPEGKRSEAYFSRNLVNSELNVYKEERERERGGEEEIIVHNSR